MSAAVKGTARLLVLAGGAKPSPAIGQALGPLGVNMMEFCKDFNAKTAALRPSALMRVRLTAFDDRTFKYSVLAPPTSWFLKRAAGVAKGAAAPGKETVASVSVKAVYEIARAKQAHDANLKEVSLEGLARSIVASARSMGIGVVGGRTGPPQPAAAPAVAPASAASAAAAAAPS
jgi:large subunit ribosomal protein L11